MLHFTRCHPAPIAALAAALLLAVAPGASGAEMLLWTAVNSESDHAIRRSELDGSDVEDAVKGIPDMLGGLALDAAAGQIYWIERGVTETRIVRAPLAGGEHEVLHRPKGSPTRLAVDPVHGAVYFPVSGGLGDPGIRRLDIATRDVKTVVPVEADDLAVDGPGDGLYWVQEGQPGHYGTDIWRSTLDGKSPAPIIHHDLEHHTTGITLDRSGGKIYWATVDYRETHAQVVSRANLDGSQVEPVTTANPGLDDWPVFLDLDLDARMLYWVNGEDGVFFRVSMDGGDAQRLHEDAGPYGPFGLVVVPSIAPPQPRFRRSDSDGDGTVQVTDPIATLGALFLGSAELPCETAADANDDGVLDITDAVATLTYLFLGGFNVPAPGPIDCGLDPTPEGGLGCAAYPGCPL